ncbi:MAG TPA: hypothetical protein VGG07_14315 [Solirubrobacteraceae bacterium]|jgi:cytochrome c oxidase subunit IV
MRNPFSALRGLGRRLMVMGYSNFMFGWLTKPALQRGGILPQREKGLRATVIRIIYWVVVIGVALIPTTPDRGPFYFPAIFALSAAWLLALPFYGRIMTSSSIDLSVFNLSAEFIGKWAAAVDRRFGLPAGVRQQLDKGAGEIEEGVRRTFRGRIMSMVYRAALQGCIAMFVSLAGMVIGPWLSTVRLEWLPLWLRGWSPVALLYGLTVPPVFVMIVTMMVPIAAYTYMANQQVQPAAEAEQVDPGDDE